MDVLRGAELLQPVFPLTQIDRENVDAVQILWRRPAVDAALTAEFPDLNVNSYLRGTPVLVDGTLYAPNAIGLVEAFDPGTGETRWIQRPESEEDARGRSFRGVVYWGGSGPGGGDGGADGGDGESAGRIISVRGPSMYALDARTGEPIASFGDGGRVDLQLPAGGRFGWSSGPDRGRGRHRRGGDRGRGGGRGDGVAGERSGGRARVRRQDRPARLDLPRDSGRGGVRGGHLGRRVARGIRRPRLVVLSQRGR
ncbi:hypothetical protein [Candidatus Palauibacter sp.]|uniref:hypothetical protein n=1 Tax=Candidatus Palauibacter sp. TaxID=3101350 RepID=UPI003B5CBAD6